MSTRISKILEAARDLSPAGRAALVDDLLASPDEPDVQIEQLWRTEAESRLAAYRRGELQVTDGAQVLNVKRHPEPIPWSVGRNGGTDGPQ